MKLNCYPLKNILNGSCKSHFIRRLAMNEWPSYLRLKQFEHNRTLRSSAAISAA